MEGIPMSLRPIAIGIALAAVLVGGIILFRGEVRENEKEELLSVFSLGGNQSIVEIPFRPREDKESVRGDAGRSTATALALASGSPDGKSPLPPPLCGFSTKRALERGGVMLNEIAWMGALGEGGGEREWIELKNHTDHPFAITGWQIVDKRNDIRIFFEKGEVIPARGFYLLERGSDDAVPGIPADKIYKGVLANSDEGIRLFSANCGFRDEASANPSWPAGNNGSRKTMERNRENFDWHTSVVSGGTPRAENSLPPAPPPPAPVPPPQPPPPAPNPPPPVPPPPPPPVQPPPPPVNPPPPPPPIPPPPPPPVAPPPPPPPNPPPPIPPPPPPPVPPPPPPASNVDHLLLGEIQVSGGPGATTNDFVEIYNPTGAPVNLNGYRLVKRTESASTDTLLKSWTSDTFVPAFGFYLWANSGYTSIGVTPDVATSGSIADNNGIAIRQGPNDTGTIIDSVAWGTAANGFGEGTLLGDLTGNQSFERKAWNGVCTSSQGSGETLGNGCDTGDNATDVEIRTTPAPQNTGSTPEP